MSTHNKTRLFVAVAFLTLAALACNRSAATVTPVTPLPTLPVPTATIPMITPLSTETSPPSPSPVSPLPTDTPRPSPTPVIPSACPPPGNPIPPDRPASLDDYPAVLATYLSTGGTAQGMERMLRDWGAITSEAGDVRELEMTGDMDLEIVAALIDPAPEADLPWSLGDVLIFQCQGGAVVPAYQGRLAINQELSDPQFVLKKVEDVNGTGRADVVYVASSCGAHTCWDRLYILEWDGTGFVNRIPDIADFPFATFAVDDGRVLVDVGGIGSVGAGYQRSYRETWQWDGKRYAVTEQIVGPPMALIHYIHDGDSALAQGDYGEAISHYQGALDDTSLPTGLFLETEEQGVAIVKSYTRFKLVVVYAASGDGRGAQSQYDLLLADHLEETPGYPYVLLGQAFWSDFLVNDEPTSACAAAITVAESDPALAESLYAGYANPVYEAADLCLVGD